MYAYPHEGYWHVSRGGAGLVVDCVGVVGRAGGRRPGREGSRARAPPSLARPPPWLTPPHAPPPPGPPQDVSSLADFYETNMDMVDPAAPIRMADVSSSSRGGGGACGGGCVCVCVGGGGPLHGHGGPCSTHQDGRREQQQHGGREGLGWATLAGWLACVSAPARSPHARPLSHTPTPPSPIHTRA